MNQYGFISLNYSKDATQSQTTDKIKQASMEVDSLGIPVHIKGRCTIRIYSTHSADFLLEETGE